MPMAARFANALPGRGGDRARAAASAGRTADGASSRPSGGPAAVALTPEERRLCAVTAGGELLFDRARQGDPGIFEVRRRAEGALGRKLALRAVPLAEIDRANGRDAAAPEARPERGNGAARPAKAAGAEDSTEIERLLRRVLEDAALLEASDIQLRADALAGRGKAGLRVRGKVTHPIHELSYEDCLRLLRVLFSRLDDGPQTFREGRAQSGAILETQKLPPGVGGVRVQTVWPGNGFHLNMRLRYAQSTLGVAGLDDLALPEPVANDLRYVSTASQGLVLVSGPTESGKSTLLAMLTREIWESAGGLLTIASAEDPVEEWYDHLLQIPVNTDEDGDAAWTEAQKLFTRIAPDVGQIGEIRTAEAAERAYSFAETGKLTLGTIHVANALDIPVRLMAGLGVGADRALDPARNPAWTSQRLLPVLCPGCRVPLEAEVRGSRPGRAGRVAGSGAAERARAAVAERFRAAGLDLSGACRRGAGCEACDPRREDGLSRGGTPGLAGRRLAVEIVLPGAGVLGPLGQGDRRGARDAWIASGGLPLSVQAWALVEAGMVDLVDYRHFVGGPEELLADRAAGARMERGAARGGRGPNGAGAAPLVFAPSARAGGGLS